MMMEMWGGMECTINRVGDEYFDQLTYSEHYSRPEDIDLFAGLGFKKMRYPVLWEKHKPDKNGHINWNWIESKLLQLKQHHIEPIAGLVHHGSGPAYVNMLQESFVFGLAAYARQVAEKFPWLEYYTPVNEPLTTSRFCGLYGLWHPHGCDDKSFIRILVNECKATVLAMQEIRKINPNAKLVQTEDLGMIHSTPAMQYQADFENQRRWLSLDLLCGKVTADHALYNYLIESGISAAEILFFAENSCPPNICGFNYYPTSERYLDENTALYPAHTLGSNSRQQYADVEVLRVGNVQSAGLGNLLKEAWHRYQLPIAVTEVHLHCTREEQLRWFAGIWKIAEQLKQEQVNILAVTAWALLGSFGWNQLLVKPDGDYEPGVFDILSGKPRMTALGNLIKKLSAGKMPEHPLLNEQGWWERNMRVIYNPEPTILTKPVKLSSPPLLIIGKTGALPYAFAKICELRNINYRLVSMAEFKFGKIEQIEKVIQQLKPWAIINTADYLGLEQAEIARDNCFNLNSQLPQNLSCLTNIYGIKLVTFSSDQVFNGQKNSGYLEYDKVNPLNIYGQSKAMAEQNVLVNDPAALIIRTGTLFSPWDYKNYATNLLHHLKQQLSVRAEQDVLMSPTYVPDLVHTCLNLLIDNEAGIWHLANGGTISWAGFATEVAQRAGDNIKLINPVTLQNMGYKALRPRFSALKSIRGNLLPSLDSALDNFFEELKLIA